MLTTSCATRGDSPWSAACTSVSLIVWVELSSAASDRSFWSVLKISLCWICVVPTAMSTPMSTAPATAVPSADPRYPTLREKPATSLVCSGGRRLHEVLDDREDEPKPQADEDEA